jgi:hypothetical protein
MKLRHFKLVTGKFFDGGTEYKIGQIVDSYHNLLKSFPNKFVEVNHNPKSANTSDIIAPPPGESDSSSDSPEGENDNSPVKLSPQEQEAAKKLAEIEEKYGKNVTDDPAFKEVAEKAKVQIYHKGVDFTVLDNADAAKLNKLHLKKKVAVVDFIETEILKEN